MQVADRQSEIEGDGRDADLALQHLVRVLNIAFTGYAVWRLRTLIINGLASS